jgi:hypothetical protein
LSSSAPTYFHTNRDGLTGTEKYDADASSEVNVRNVSFSVRETTLSTDGVAQGALPKKIPLSESLSSLTGSERLEGRRKPLTEDEGDGLERMSRVAVSASVESLSGSARLEGPRVAVTEDSAGLERVSPRTPIHLSVGNEKLNDPREL